MIKNIIKSLIITLIVGFLYFYVALPPINIHSMEFYVFLFIIYAVFIMSLSFFEYGKFFDGKVISPKIKVSKVYKYQFVFVPLIIILIVVVNFIFSPLFNAKSYANRIKVNTGKDFATEVKEVDFSKVPLLDKDSTSKIGDRVVGEMTDLVSQFYVSNLYSQINYDNKIVRVTPLEYADIIKFFINRGNGIPYYVVVDSVTGSAELKKLDKGMKYMPSAYFNDNLYRKLRFSYPTLIFGDANFELDNDGKPFFVIPTIKYSGVGLKEEIDGVVILDPVTGDSKRYLNGDVPTWIDHVYNASLIIEQFNDYGLYNGGFFNSLFGQKNVVATTDGYNYVTMDDDVYLYTGVTSVASDESNLGFILSNLRTKETNYYLIPGAEEFSAMASAEGQVQQMSYVSTFPLLINLNGRPTYLVSLKDNAGLVKMYGFVDVQDYQKVAVTDVSLGIHKAKDNYLKLIGNTKQDSYTEITVASINTVIIDGNSYYYITDTDNEKYRVSIKINEDVIPFIKNGDIIKVNFTSNSNIREIYSLTI
jgi:hypothetical protein